MRILGSLLLAGIDASYSPGINEVDCAADYFRAGAAWPLEDVADAGTTVRLCQNTLGKPHKFATLYSVTDKIPVYSSGMFTRYSNKPTYSRPDSHWTYLCNGLCLAEGSYLPERESFYCNLSSVGSSNYDFCDNHQAQDNDYKGNTGNDLGRGHLVPNGIMNQDQDGQKATFTLTNISLQYSNFNGGAWNQLECMAREYLERELDGLAANIITGVYGTLRILNENDSSKQPVRMPFYYWMAFCYSDDTTGESYSWAYMQANDPDEKQSSPDNFMSVKQFTDTYYEGANLFDEACQNPENGYGPWFPIIQDWSSYKKRYGC